MNKLQSKHGVFLLTVPVLENYEVVEYYGLVGGRAIYGANFIKDFFARIRDTVGGRVGGYEKALGGAMEGALAEMALDASRLGANAVLSIDVKTGIAGKGLLMATCTGTAVALRPRARSS